MKSRLNAFLTSAAKQHGETSEDHENQTVESVVSLSPDVIENWQFSDRPETELGNIEELANDMRKIGQQQPCIVRYHPEKTGIYELIIGERRWRAAKSLGMTLQVIIRNLSNFEAALAQAAENANRVDLSDYAKGMSFARLINQNILTPADLARKLGQSKQYISALLSFEKIPSEVAAAIGDFSLVSARTAETIKQLSALGMEYSQAIIALAQSIRTGKLGHVKLREKVNTLVHKLGAMKQKNFSIKVYAKSGEHVFTWRRVEDNSLFIALPKKAMATIDAKKVDLEQLTEQLTKVLGTLIS